MTYSLVLIFSLSLSNWTVVSPGYPSLQACREDAGRLAARMHLAEGELIGCQEENANGRTKDFWPPIMPQ